MNNTILCKVAYSVKTFINKNKNHEIISKKLGPNLHFAPKTESDVLSLSESAKRWSGIPEKFMPDCKIPNSSIKEHHDICGINCNIREAIDCADDEIDCFFGTYRKIRKIDKGFENLTPLEKDCIGYRGRTKQAVNSFNADFNIIKNAKVGDIINPDTGYSYLAFNKHDAQGFTSNLQESILYEIRIPKGAKVSRNLEHNGEILMPRNSQYRVVSNKQTNNIAEIVLEYILPNKSNLEEIEQVMKEKNIPFEKPAKSSVQKAEHKGHTIYDKLKY